jgi:integrase
MGRKATERGALWVSKLSKPGMHFVGGVDGLAIQVLQSGARTWILRVMVGGKRRDMGLGGYPAVTLAGAREAARIARDKIRNGVDPVEEGRALRSALAATRASAMTFEQCAAAYIAVKESEWANAKHGQQWRNTLETYAFPVVGKLLVRDVVQAHVLRILEPLWATKTETATRLRGRIESVLDWATVRGYREGDNPARWKGHLDKLLAMPGKIKKVEHLAALPFVDMGAFWASLRKQEGMGSLALQFAILTAARSGEVRGASWNEIDLTEKFWKIPAQRMKMKREHKVPLSDEAVKLIEALPHIAGSDLVFPNSKGTALSDMTLTAVIRRMGQGGRVTPHGFRSTFRDWASERTNYPRDVCEMALAHAIGDKVEAAYRRGDLMEKRTRLMTDWAKFINTAPVVGDNVLQLRGAA